ncbi:MAG: sigma-70 family RNA polymerase sigma factor [Chitinophagaceae bacterium]|nr:sigma-70 family RNA polymerase sigma factor [Chitinophagaceae bacterium]
MPHLIFSIQSGTHGSLVWREVINFLKKPCSSVTFSIEPTLFCKQHQLKPDKQQFLQLIKEHELLIFKVCRIYGHTDHERQDLYQEIMIQLWKGFESFRGEAKFTTWMYRVAVYTAISGIRKTKNSKVEYRDPTQIPEPSFHPDDGKEREQQLAALYDAIKTLDEISKAIVMLYLDDKSYQEMEEILGINEAHLRVKMSRIKERLKKLTKN